MKGHVSEDALEQYSKLAAEKEGLDFSEGETYDFARCMRSDGTFYGTRGKCKKGKEAGDADPVEKARGKVSEAKASGDKKKLAGKPRASASELKASQEKLFNDAKTKRAAAREAEKAAKQVAKETKGDKSKEARQRRLEAARAWGKANTAADSAQRKWMKEHERWSKASGREEKARMSPEQRAEQRRIDKIIKERG